MTRIIGIDPGAHGATAVLNCAGKLLEVHDAGHRGADSWRSRPPKRDDAAHRNGMMPPGVKGDERRRDLMKSAPLAVQGSDRCQRKDCRCAREHSSEGFSPGGDAGDRAPARHLGPRLRGALRHLGAKSRPRMTSPNTGTNRLIS